MASKSQWMFLQSSLPIVLVTSTAVVASRTTAGVDIVAIGEVRGLLEVLVNVSVAGY